MSKFVCFVCAVIITVMSSCKKNDDEKKSGLTTVEIGNQIWTSTNYAANGVELFSYEDAKKVPIPDGFRLPTKEDWGNLFIYLGYSGTVYTHTAVYTGSVYITESSMEGSYDNIKSILSTDQWDEVRGTNTTGFNAKPIIDNSYVDYYVSDPVYGYTELFGDGFYMGTFNRDPRSYSSGSYPDKYAIRFVKDK